MDSEGALDLPNDDSLCLNDPAVAFVSIPKSTSETLTIHQGISLKFHDLLPRGTFIMFFFLKIYNLYNLKFHDLPRVYFYCF